ncbi:MAG: hypothetical protein A2076_15195 [Geobacteraceae bacterium GWC2_53_11]|nr:MAG: hypothetical protein A2076_15195 [Geobacteraceae bacterium GWC2_53_11]
MASHKLFLLDVGHGNCSIVVNGDKLTVIDSPTGATLLETLESLGATEIENVLISHADADHIGGITNLLLDNNIRIKRVFVNPDSVKDTAVWYDFRCAVKDAATRGTTTTPALTTTQSPDLSDDTVQFEVIAPTPETALGGVGSQDLAGRSINSNSMSVVIRVLYKGVPVALLPGDIDSAGLENLVAGGKLIQAKYFVYPHHGGLSKGSSVAFTTEICRLVSPQVVVLSIARGGKYNNPRPEIISAICEVLPDAHIICTQLATHCSKDVPPVTEHHCSFPARGMSDQLCCGGTISIDFDRLDESPSEIHADHIAFLDQVSTPMCLSKGMKAVVPST